MKDTIDKLLQALFVEDGRLVSVRAILALAPVLTLCYLTYDGTIEPEGLLGLAGAAVAWYFKERDTNGNGS